VLETPSIWLCHFFAQTKESFVTRWRSGQEGDRHVTRGKLFRQVKKKGIPSLFFSKNIALVSSFHFFWLETFTLSGVACTHLFRCGKQFRSEEKDRAPLQFSLFFLAIDSSFDGLGSWGGTGETGGYAGRSHCQRFNK